MAIEIDITAGKSITELRTMLRETKDELATLGSDTPGFAQAAAKAGAIKDAMKDVNEQVAIFSGGSNFEQAGTALGQLKDSIMSLDFEGAAEKGKALTDIVGKMSFSGAAKGVKDLGTTFMSLGKALLTNPLFLLAAVIVAIVAAVVMLMNKMGLLKPILNAIKAVVGAIVDAFEALTDAMGLTNNAGIEAAEEEKKRSEVRMNDLNAELELRKSIYDKTKDLTIQEAEMFTALTGIKTDTLTEVQELEVQTLDARKDAAYAALDVAKETYGEDSDEYKEALEKKEQAVASFTKFEQDLAIARYNTSLGIDKQLKMLQAGAIAGEKERSKAFLNIQEQEALAKLDTAIKNQKDLSFLGTTQAQRDQATEDIKKLEQSKTLIIADFAKKRKEIDTKAAAGVAATAKSAADNSRNAAEKAKAERERLAAEALKELKQDNKLKLDELKEGTQAYLTEQLAGNTRELDLIKKKKTSLKMSDKDLKLYINDYNDKAIALQAAFNNKMREEDNKSAIKNLELAKENAQTSAELRAAELALIEETSRQALQTSQNEYKLKLEGLVVGGEEQKKVLEAQATDEKIIAENLKKEKATIRLSELEEAVTFANAQRVTAETAAATALSVQEFELEQFKGKQKEKITLMMTYYNALDKQLLQQKNDALKVLNDEKAIIDAKVAAGIILSNAELERTKTIEAEKAAIEEQYRQAKIVADKTAEDTIEATRREKFDKAREDASAYADGAAELLTMISDIQNADLETQTNKMKAKHEAELAGLEEGSEAYAEAKKRQAKEEEDLAKKVFEINKKQQIAGAVIQGIQAVLAAYSSGSAIPVIGSVMGPVFAGIAAIAAAKNIQRIQSTTFGSSSTPSAPSASTASVPSSNTTSTPSFGLFGQGNNQNTVNASQQPVNVQNNLQVQAYVSESEITNTQKRVARFRTSAEL
jgi:hypothetical protein